MSIFVCKFCGDNTRHEYLTEETFKKMKNHLRNHLIKKHGDTFAFEELKMIDNEVLDYFVERQEHTGVNRKE